MTYQMKGVLIYWKSAAGTECVVDKIISLHANKQQTSAGLFNNFSMCRNYGEKNK